MSQQAELKDGLEEWVELLENEGETSIAEKISNLNPKEIIDDENFQNLKNLATDKKAESYLESLKEEITKELGLSRNEFNVEKYKDLSKKDLAKEISEYCVNTLSIRPVKLGESEEEVDFYQYKPQKGIWEYLSEHNLNVKCKDLAGDQYSNHLRREFLNHIRFHRRQIPMQEMGTDQDWIVINDGKKLCIGDLSDLSDLKVKEAKREDMAIHKINTDYSPDSECPEFLDFIEFMLDNKEKQIKTLQEFLGWTLKFPDRKFKKALLILGVSNSGKSQLAEVWEQFFSSNSQTVTNLSIPQLGMKRAFLLKDLQNSILNVDKDLSNTEIQDPSKIKSITAQESIQAEPKGKQSYNIQPTAKHLVCANVSPTIEDRDDAFLGRFLTLKAPNRVPRRDRVKDLGKKLFEKERDGIFMWALEGLKRLEDQGEFTLMPDSDETRRMWWEFGSSIHRFLWQNCEVTRDVNDDIVQKDRLYELYELWVDKTPTVQDKAPLSKFKYEVADQPGISEDRKSINGTRQRCFTGIQVDEDSLTSGFEVEKDDRDKSEIETE